MPSTPSAPSASSSRAPALSGAPLSGTPDPSGTSRASRLPRLRGHTARDRAAHVLHRLHNTHELRHGLTVQQAVDEALHKDPRLSRQDAGLCTELVYGALRCELRLTHLLHRHLREPDKLPQLLHAVLLAASYELLYLDRIPAHATVNWAVQAVRDALGTGLARLTNAVLRTIDRLGDTVRHDDWYAAACPDPSDLAERLSIVRSIPLWIVRLWLEAYGEERANALALASGRTPWPAVRINRLKPEWQATRDALLAVDAPASPGASPVSPVSVGASGLLFPPGDWPPLLPRLLQTGAVSWQGAGTQHILHALGAATWQGPIWDACAGRGGKTCALLEMGRDVRLSSDPHAARIASLAKELDRLGLPHPTLLQASAQSLRPDFTPQTILLDVPCSGLGTLARRPDTRLHRGPEQARELAALQSDIVDAAWTRLAPGGRLAYITCTVNPAENELQIARLLRLHPSARLEIECPPAPGDHGADIMYGAVVVKGEG